MSYCARVCLQILTATTLGLGWAATAHADDTSDLRALLDESIVTTASKSEETVTKAPAISSVITSEELRRYGIHSLDEAIDFLSLGMVTGNPLHQVDVGARGVLLTGDQGNHVLLLVNGHAINEPLYGASRFGRGAGIPLELVDHIEVILGPGSVLYGTNAMLGVVNVITKAAKDYAGPHIFGEVEVGKSERAGAGAGYAFPLFGTPSELTVQVEYYHQSGPTFGFGPQNLGTSPFTLRGDLYRFSPNGPATGVWGGSATDSYYATVPSGLVRLVSGPWELTLHGSTYKRATPYPVLSFPAAFDFNQPDSYELDRNLWADLKYQVTLSRMVQLSARLYGDSTDYQQNAITSQDPFCSHNAYLPCRTHLSGVSRWTGLELQTSLDWAQDGKIVTLFGMDGRVAFVQRKQDLINEASGLTVLPSLALLHRYDLTLGTFVQQTWQPLRMLDLNAGARLDSREQYKPVISPRLAASMHAWNNGTIKLIYAEAFRSPAWNERSPGGTYEEGGDSQSALPGELQPERVRSVEAALEQKLGAQRLMVGVFRSRWTDLIENHILTLSEQLDAVRKGELFYSSPQSTIGQLRNITAIDNYGLNASWTGSLLEGQLRYGTNITAAVAQQTDQTTGVNHALPVTPQLFGNAQVLYDLRGSWPTLALATHAMSQRPADRAFTGSFTPTPYAPVQVELRATVSGPAPLLPGLSYRLSADYAFASRGPYVVNPLPHALSTIPSAELVPVDQFRVAVGLQYDLLP